MGDQNENIHKKDMNIKKYIGTIKKFISEEYTRKNQQQIRLNRGLNQ